jgi:hypothetical protein
MNGETQSNAEPGMGPVQFKRPDPFSRIRVEKPGDDPLYVFTLESLTGNHLVGFEIVKDKDQAGVYTAYRGDAISHTLKIIRMFPHARPEPVSYAEWVETQPAHR